MSRATSPLLSEDNHVQQENNEQLHNLQALQEKLRRYIEYLKNLDYKHPFLIPHYTVTGCLTGGAVWFAFQLLGINEKIPDLAHVLIAHLCGAFFLCRSYFAYSKTTEDKLNDVFLQLSEIQDNLSKETCPYSCEKLQFLETFLDEQLKVLKDQKTCGINAKTIISGLSRFTNANAEFAAGTTAITTFVVSVITVHYFFNDISILNSHKQLTASPWFYIPLAALALGLAAYEYIRADRGQDNLNILIAHHGIVKTVKNIIDPTPTISIPAHR